MRATDRSPSEQRLRRGGSSLPTVVVTRPSADASPLVKKLEKLGVRVLRFPVVEILPPDDGGPLARAVVGLNDFDWIMFSSVNGVRAVFRQLGRSRVDRRSLRVATVGPATGGELQSGGWRVDLLPAVHTSEGLLATLDEARVGLQGARVLLPSAEQSLSTLHDGLVARGALVTKVDAYRSLDRSALDVADLREELLARGADLLTLTAPSTAERFRSLVGDSAIELPVVAIGPVTARAARELGYRVVAVADPHSVEGLVATVAKVLGKRTGAEAVGASGP